jgi:hypothetical protein
MDRFMGYWMQIDSRQTKPPGQAKAQSGLDHSTEPRPPVFRPNLEGSGTGDQGTAVSGQSKIRDQQSSIVNPSRETPPISLTIDD